MFPMISLLLLQPCCAGRPKEAAKGKVCTMADETTVRILTAHPASGLLNKLSAGWKALAALPGAADKLLAVARDPGCNDELRFKAYEAYFAQAGEGAQKLGAQDHKDLPRLYAGALARDVTVDASLWSLPQSVRSSATSRRLIEQGKAALPYLQPLLANPADLPYAGSETSALADVQKLRVKDLAAALAAAILGQPYDADKDPVRRDQQIAHLKGNP